MNENVAVAMASWAFGEAGSGSGSGEDGAEDDEASVVAVGRYSLAFRAAISVDSRVQPQRLLGVVQ